MMHDVKMGKRTRKSFSHISEVLEMPDLIEVQKNSYYHFLKEDLRDVFNDISPIVDFSGKLVLEFVDHRIDLDKPKYSIEESKSRDVNYAAPLRVTVRLINKETGEVKQQEVFMGDFPLMTPQGTFIINGAERVIVSQLVRSPGAYYAAATDKMGKQLFSSQVIPNRGAWLEYETDSNGILYVKIDRQRKVFITALLRAIGYGTNAEILDLLGNDERLEATLAKDPNRSVVDGLVEIYRRQRPGEPPTEESARNLLHGLFFDNRYDLARVGRYKYNKKLALKARIRDQIAGETVTDPETGEVFVEEGQRIDKATAEAIQNAGINAVVVSTEEHGSVKVVGNQFASAAGFLPFKPIEAGLNEDVHIPTLKALLKQAAEEGVEGDALKDFLRRHYDDLIPRHIVPDDMVGSISYLINLPYGIGKTDDIDHLGNRRIRSVGEL
ncbi:MAG: DNA-directed RNA polymerase subunit beta, partial [Clostridia bacterium]|nr:DNA-directed RNA polymerase subunit beta [Clostridia bacterium]